MLGHIASLAVSLRKHRPAALSGAAFAVLLLGYVGFSQHATLGDTGPLDRLYLTLQLFILSWSPEGPVPVTLQVARFAAPVVAVLGAAAILRALVAGQLGVLQARFMHGHTVICGAGRKGSALAAELSRSGSRVVVVDLEDGESRISEFAEATVVKIRGDATQPHPLRRARVGAARRIVALCGEDGRNVEVARTAAQLVGQGTDSIPRIFVHLSSDELFRLIRTADVFRMQRVEAVNALETASRGFLAKYGVGRQLVLLGGDVFCRQLILQAARFWRTLPHAAEGRLPLSLVAPHAKQTARALVAGAPTLPKIINLRAINCQDESTAAQEYATASVDSPRRTVVAACCATEGQSVGTALRARAALGDDATVVACVGRTDAGLGELLGSRDNAYGVHPFSVAQAGVDPEVLFEWRRELLARVLHTDYLRRQAPADALPAGSPLLAAWDELSDSERVQDRHRAALLLRDLEAFGFTVEDSLAWNLPEAVVSEDEIERMAKAEHRRWKSSLEGEGWRWAPKKDRERKLHPDLVDWDELSEPSKGYNLDVARELPSVLAGLGVRAERTYEPRGLKRDS